VSGLLKAAQEHGWGFGPISLVMRLNRYDAQPMYVRWEYEIPGGSWRFSAAGLRNGHLLKQARDVMALVKTSPWKPDYGRYELAAGDPWCKTCGDFVGEFGGCDFPFPELLQAIEDHEKEHHADQG